MGENPGPIPSGELPFTVVAFSAILTFDRLAILVVGVAALETTKYRELNASRDTTDTTTPSSFFSAIILLISTS